AWTRPAGAALLIVAALAAASAAKSGDQAHGPAERIPGAREAVQRHEHDGERARNMLIAIAVLEIAGLAFFRKEQIQRGIYAGSSVLGLVGGWMVYEAAEHGGQVVYEYAGGVGTRGGDSAHVRQLLVAGLFHQAQADRQAGRTADAARLFDELVVRMPGDLSVALLGIESQLKDRGDVERAMAALATLTVPDDDARLVTRKGLLLGDALVAAGQPDAARTVLNGLAQRFPESGAIKQAIERLNQP
ncbi:MAG: tetratricopeptide repeat protein, partial [Gemmatimonadota bacterium]